MEAYKLLMVDDEQAVRVNVRYAIERSGLCFENILEAGNGLEALQILDHAPGGVDIVITDIQMPVMDGITLLERIHERYPDMPVIMLTVHSDFEHARRALRASATDYVTKPFSDDELIAALRRVQDMLKSSAGQGEKLEDIQGEARPVQSADDHWMAQVKRYIEEHYEEAIGLEKVAKIFHVSSKHLSRAFKRDTGEEFTNYIAKKRINQARVLLRTTDMSVSEVAKSVGYMDTQYFYRVFKQAMHKTPAQYREE